MAGERDPSKLTEIGTDGAKTGVRAPPAAKPE
jgi:hypothetical protein